MSLPDKKKIIVVLGPTASGKTALSIAIAKAFHTEIISGDSMLVYRGFDIGSAKPSMAEREGIVHYLIDILSPDASFNVTDFQRLAAEKIDDISDRGMLPIIAGGTGLYLKALLEGYEFNDEGGDKAYRAKLIKLGEEKGKAYVHGLLEKVDPQTAARLHVNDFRRVVRALEVARNGEHISSKRIDGALAYDAFVIGLNCDRQLLYKRINERVDRMIDAGLYEEVLGLIESGVPCAAQAMKGIGYRETVDCILGQLPLESLPEAIKLSTRHFAKRQLTWYRKMPYIHWYNIDEYDGDMLKERVITDIGRYFDGIKISN